MTHSPVVIITGASRGLGAATARWLALKGPSELSGQFLDYDDPRISRAALAFFGKKLDK